MRKEKRAENADKNSRPINAKIKEGKIQMKKFITMTVGVSILSFVLATESFAQQGMKWQGSGGWGPGTQYGRLYNPQSMETISGEVVKVDLITPAKGMSGGVHLMIRTDKETISVHLGPAWYLQRQDVKMIPGDRVEITGSRITFQGKPTIIAAELKKGEEILRLRDENGFPVWSGWRRR